MKRINLLPAEYIKEQKIRYYVKLGIILVIIECLGGVYVAITPLLELNKEAIRKAEVEKKLNNEAFSEVYEINTALDEVEKKVIAWGNNLTSMEKEAFISTALLDTLLSSVPLGVTIDTLDIQEETQTIDLAGRTTNHFTTMGYISYLQSLYPMGKLTFEIGESEDESIYRTFTIKLELPIPVEGAEAVEGSEAVEGNEPIEGAETVEGNEAVEASENTESTSQEAGEGNE